MTIPETQLERWSHQGSVTQSSATYTTIRSALSARDSPYSTRDYTIFLQGSYGNNTNIYAESDVDIVIRLDSCFCFDIDNLPDNQKGAFQQAYPDSSLYNYVDFKRDVLKWLTEQYGSAVKPGSKAIKIAANGSRRSADVLVAVSFKRYITFQGLNQDSHADGICFWAGDGTRIVNFPQQHSENCTAKHQGTNKWFKPMVRILKNMRSRLVKEQMIADGVAPSYYLEGLLYNVPNDKFGMSYEDSFVNSINWILDADRSKFVCANEEYYLLREGSPVTWRDDQCTAFLKAVCELWRQW